MTTPQKPKKRILSFFGGGFLILALIAAYFYIDAERRYFDCFFYDLRTDYGYAFPKDSISPVMLEKDGFKWPSVEADADTAFLKMSIRTDWTSLLFLPYVEIRCHNIVLKQYFEKTGRGIRYLNLSQLLQATPALTQGEKLVIKGHHLSWNQGTSELYLFRNPEIKKAKILILAPHPDDAEIATFGLYNDQDVYVVTITAGEGGKSNYKRFFKNPERQALFKGKVRTWDSIVIPFWGGISPLRCFNLGYFDESLSKMFQNPSQIIPSSFAGTIDLSTFRQYNVSDLLPKNPAQGPTWNNLVADLEHLLTEINPSIIITPNPVTDGHSDHQYTTLALLEALQRTPTVKGSLYLYTVHGAYASRWPLGTAKSVVSLPPFFSKLRFFEKIYSLHLPLEVYTRKFFAIDDMHDIRPVYFLNMQQATEALPAALQALYLHWKGVLTMRKYLRMDELFFVVPMENAPRLREIFLKNLAPEH
ncbi:MAG: PIG-L family deacetylase [Candidatus Omnitrophota bacterium]